MSMGIERGRTGPGPEPGSVTVWMALVLLMSVTIGVALFRAAGHEAERAEAQATADLAALAGVEGGRTAAAAIASANDAGLVSFDEREGHVRITVSRHSVRADADAEPGVTSSDEALPPDP